jgi:hypothetical protein
VWLAEPLCAIFNESIRSGFVPLSWRQANVIPVPKVHPPIAIETDIRPISLTPTISKILESFVGQWILTYVTGYLDRRQYGGIKGRSTTHALVDMLHHWHQAIVKLQAFNVPTILLKWLCSFFIQSTPACEDR